MPNTPDPTDAVMAAGALLIVPLLFGTLLGVESKRLNAPRWWGPMLFVVAPLAGLAAPWVPIGFWNLAFAALVFATGYWVASDAARPGRSLVALAVVVALSWSSLEVGVRVFMPQHPLLQGVGPMPPRLYAEPTRAVVVRGEIPILWPGPRSRPGDFDSGMPYHLRLGDSMITGDELTAQLTQRFPGVAEAEIGIPGSGPDIQFYMLRRWLQEGSRRPLLVSHHLFAGNDIGNLDCDYDFCGGAGLLEYGADGPVPCRHLQWKYSARFIVAESQPPYVFQLASGFSALARIGLGAVRRLGNKDEICRTTDADDPRPADWDVRWAHFESIMRAERDLLRRQGIGLVAIVLPYRPSLESPTPASTGGYEVQARMVEVLGRLQIRTLDAWPLFRDAVARDGSATYFRGTNDIHLSPRGIQLYADWLAKQLGPDLTPDAPSEADRRP